MEQDAHIIEHVISLLDIIVILMLEEDPVIGVVLVVLLKVVTKDKILRVLFILLVISLGVMPKLEET